MAGLIDMDKESADCTLFSRAVIGKVMLKIRTRNNLKLLPMLCYNIYNNEILYPYTEVRYK